MRADSALVADAIFALPREVLAGHACLLEDVNLFNILSSKVTSFFDEDAQDSLARKVKAGADRMSASMNDTDVAFRLLAQLCQTLNVQPRQFASTRDFDDVAADVVQASVVALRNADKSFSGTTLQDLVQFTVESMFGEVGKRFDHLAAEKQADLLNAIRDFIAQLPHERQTEIRDKLGINDLSDDYLRKAVLSGGLASVFAGAVSVGGFGFYTGAVSLLATVAGFVGLTLPFAVYTTLTSAVAVGSNPLFVLPVVGLGGFVLFRTQNDAVRKRLAVNTVVQLALAGSSLDSFVAPADNRRCAIAAWKEAVSIVEGAAKLRTVAQAEVNTAQQSLASAKTSMFEIREMVAAAAKEKELLLTRLRNEVESAAQDIGSGAWGEEARRIGAALVASLEAQRKAKKRGIPGSGLERLFGCVDRALGAAAANSAHAAALDTAVGQMIALEVRNALRTPGRAATLLSAISAKSDLIVANCSKIAALDADIEAKRRDLVSAKKHLSDRKRDETNAGSKYWGLVPHDG